ncbi:MAG: gluconate 2-dehydrogenase [Flavobacteriales bacterium]|nr:MAG: gluconate 2-dehydrogenase [Flavobacteriales bacterium]
MDRRQALRNIGLGMGYAMASPAVMQLLQSCKTETEKWQPVFFSPDQGEVIKRLVDIILPETDSSPGALSVNVPEFLDFFISKVYTKEKQNNYKKTIDIIIAELKETNASLDKLTDADYDNFLAKYLKADKSTADGFKERDLEVFEALVEFRSQVVWVYKTSEQIGENVMAYDPVPGKQLGCVDLIETTGGKGWSL